jgi:hypothetical protein
MAKQPTVAKNRSRIPSDWKPSPDDCQYAEDKEIADIEQVAEEFRDYHAARGSLFLDWHAAWRTWCRNQVKFTYGNRKPATALLAAMNAPDPSDPYGARHWASRLPDVRPEGDTLILNGWDVVGVAVDACEAAGLPSEWRGDLMHIALWLRDGVTPEHIIGVIRSTRRPRQPGEWWWYDDKVSGRQRPKSGMRLTP